MRKTPVRGHAKHDNWDDVSMTPNWGDVSMTPNWG